MPKFSTKKRIAFSSTLCVLIVSVVAMCALLFVGAKQTLAVSGDWSNYWVEFSKRPKDEDGYYKITSAGQLAYINNNASDYFKADSDNKFRLYANIDMSAHYWNPSSSTFHGIFDGNGYTISFLKISNGGYKPGLSVNPKNQYSGLFKNVDGATIQNLTLSGVYIYGYQDVGGIAGSATYSTFSNIIVEYSEVYATNNVDTSIGAMAIGGIAGVAEHCTFNYCRLKNTFVAIANANEDARNNHSITLYGGGIVGKSLYNNIDYCIVQNDQRGIITISTLGSKVLVYDLYMGGIAGYFIGDGHTDHIMNSYNTSKVYGGTKESEINVSKSYFGGIVGKVDNTTITACFNKGEIIGYASLKVEYNEDSKINIISSLGVNSIGNGTKEYTHLIKTCGAFTGGIVGYMDNNSKIQDCYNAGTITNNDSGSNVKLMGNFSTYYSADMHYYPALLICEIKNVEHTSHSICGNRTQSSLLSNCYSNKNIWETNQGVGSVTASVVVDYSYATHNQQSTENYEWKDAKIAGLKNDSRCISLSGWGEQKDGYFWLDGIVLSTKNNKVQLNYKSTQLQSYGPCNAETDDAVVGLSSFSSSYYAVDSKINNGLPHLKCFYWQDCASIG